MYDYYSVGSAVEFVAAEGVVGVVVVVVVVVLTTGVDEVVVEGVVIVSGKVFDGVVAAVEDFEVVGVSVDSVALLVVVATAGVAAGVALLSPFVVGLSFASVASPPLTSCTCARS